MNVGFEDFGVDMFQLHGGRSLVQKELNVDGSIVKYRSVQDELLLFGANEHVDRIRVLQSMSRSVLHVTITFIGRWALLWSLAWRFTIFIASFLFHAPTLVPSDFLEVLGVLEVLEVHYRSVLLSLLSLTIERLKRRSSVRKDRRVGIYMEDYVSAQTLSHCTL